MEAPNVATRVLAVATFTYTSSENEYIKISNETDTELLVYVKEDPKAMLRTKKKSTVSASIRELKRLRGHHPKASGEVKEEYQKSMSSTRARPSPSRFM